MVNQNPQPECYTERFQFLTTATTGTSVTQQVLTNQAHNEELRIYSVSAKVTAAAGTEVATTDVTNNFKISLLAGPNAVPSKSFRLDSLLNSRENTITFSAPVLILHRQPLQIVVEWIGNGSPAAIYNVSITLNGEMYLQEYFG